MKPTIVTKTFIACPGCGSTAWFDVQRLIDAQRATTFGPWGCRTDGCLVEIRGQVTAAGDIEIEQQQAAAPGLALLKFRDLYIVRDELYGRVRNPDFFYHSHQCPQNILQDVTAVFDPAEGHDPHGVLRFVANIEATTEARVRLEQTSTLEALFALFRTDGQPAPSEWPERNGGMLPWIAEARRSNAGQA
jgi:hypothetical protein